MPEQKGTETHPVSPEVSVQVKDRGQSQIGSERGAMFPENHFSWERRPEKQLTVSMLDETGPGAAGTARKSLRLVIVRILGLEQAIEVDLVEEIIMSPHVSPLIKAPFFVEGVIRLRGKIVPVVDLKRAMRLTADSAISQESVVVIVKLWGRRIGFRVESVLELLSVPGDSVKPSASLLGGVDSRFMKGMTYFGDRFIAILDLEAMLSENHEMIFRDEQSLDDAVDLEQNLIRDKQSVRRIISFTLDAEIFGVDMVNVAEIMEMIDIMPVPNVAELVLGLINLRGAIVPVIDLRTFFGLQRKTWTKDSRIVIMKEKNLLVGVAVDSMWESLRLSLEDFQPAPHSSTKVDSSYFKDISIINGRVVSVLDISRILSDTAGKTYSEYHSKESLVSRPMLKPGGNC